VPVVELCTSEACTTQEDCLDRQGEYWEACAAGTWATFVCSLRAAIASAKLYERTKCLPSLLTGKLKSSRSVSS